MSAADIGAVQGSAPTWWDARIPLVALGGALAVGVGVLANGSPVLVVGACLAALLTLLIAANPDLATLLVAGLLYGNVAGVAVKQHGLPYLAGIVVPMLLLVPLGFLAVRGRPLIVARELPLVLAYLTVQVISTVFASKPSLAAGDLLTFVLEGIGLYFLVTNLVRTPAMLRRVVWTLILVGGALGALSVWQALTHTYHSDYLGFAQVDQTLSPTGQRVGQPRLAGPIGDHARYAQVMLALAPLAFFRYRGERHRALRLLAAACAALLALATILTFSRGGAVGLAVLIVLMALMRTIKVRQLALVVAALAIVLVAVPSYRDRVATLSAVGGTTAQSTSQAEPDTSIQSRATENLVAALVFADHPLIGVGPGLFQYSYPDYALRAGDYSGVIDIRVKSSNRQAHDLYLAIGAETGIAGLIVFLTFVAFTLRRLSAARRRLNDHSELANMATAFLLAVVSYLTTGLFLHFAYIRYFWLLVALASAASTLALEAARSPSAGRGLAPRRLTNSRD